MSFFSKSQEITVFHLEKMADTKKRGVVLFIVLAALMVVIVLANIILSIMLSQSRLTHHQVSRIQAYYASFAGMNLAYDGLRTGNWPMPGASESYDTYLCRATTSNPNCASIPPVPAPAVTIDANIPEVIEMVRIRVAGRAVDGCDEPSGSQVCINATATYTFQ